MQCVDRPWYDYIVCTDLRTAPLEFKFFSHITPVIFKIGELCSSLIPVNSPFVARCSPKMARRSPKMARHSPQMASCKRALCSHSQSNDQKCPKFVEKKVTCVCAPPKFFFEILKKKIKSFFIFFSKTFFSKKRIFRDLEKKL